MAMKVNPNKAVQRLAKHQARYLSRGPSPVRKITGSGALDLGENIRNTKINARRKKHGLPTQTVD